MADNLSTPLVLEHLLDAFLPMTLSLAPLHITYMDAAGKQTTACVHGDGSADWDCEADTIGCHTRFFLSSGLAYVPMVSPLPFSLPEDLFADFPSGVSLCPHGCCMAVSVVTGGVLVMGKGSPFQEVDQPLAQLFLMALSREIAMTVERLRHKTQIDFARNIIRSMDSSFLVLDADLTIIGANPAACGLLGLPEERLVGSKASDVVFSKLIVQEARDSRRAIKDREAFIKLKNKTLHILKTAIPVFGQDGSVIAVLDHFREIKETRQLVSRMSGTRAIFTFEDIIHKCTGMADIISMGRMAATNVLSVLISGESGTGKELFAHAIHLASERRNAPFVVIDCASMPRELVPSELFGYEEGAFTGSRRGGMPGKFELANGGTIFLDELGELPLEVQAQFLRVLQCREVTRISGKEALPIDIRVISATNRELSQEVRLGNFREDLFYRLNVLSLHIPPLRSRQEDIEPLAMLFVDKYAARFNRKFRLAPEALHALQAHPWPGNVRELENAIARAVHLHGNTVGNGDVIGDIPLLSPLRATDNAAVSVPQGMRCVSCGADAGGTITPFRDLEIQAIQKAIAASNGNISRAAQMLGVARSTIYKKISAW